MQIKICSTCKEEKSLDKFTKNKNGKLGVHNQCKECRKKEYQKNKKHKFEYQKKYVKENKERIKKTKKEYYEKNKEKICKKVNKYRLANKEKINKKKKEYYQENKDKIREKARIYRKERRKTDICFRLKKNIRKSIYCFMKGEKNGQKTEILIGQKMKEIKEHIEKQFNENMSWDNYGTYFHIDHIIPISLYDFTDKEQIKKCWNKRNLRPLSIKENLIKRDKLDVDLIEQYQIKDLLP
jgi:hypothetical protein